MLLMIFKVITILDLQSLQIIKHYSYKRAKKLSYLVEINHSEWNSNILNYVCKRLYILCLIVSKVRLFYFQKYENLS
jgi:hypothetical protein